LVWLSCSVPAVQAGLSKHIRKWARDMDVKLWMEAKTG
jgi:hypothetical protein